jgi:hypothetical protein
VVQTARSGTDSTEWYRQHGVVQTARSGTARSGTDSTEWYRQHGVVQHGVVQHGVVQHGVHRIGAMAVRERHVTAQRQTCSDLLVKSAWHLEAPPPCLQSAKYALYILAY